MVYYQGKKCSDEVGFEKTRMTESSATAGSGIYDFLWHFPSEQIE